MRIKRQQRYSVPVPTILRGNAYTYLILACCFLGTVHASGEERESLSATPACQVARGHLLTHCTLDGVGPYAFLVDAAVTTPIVDTTVAKYVDLPETGTPVVTSDAFDREQKTPMVWSSALTCATLPTMGYAMAKMDLSHLSAQLGVQVAGILPAHQPGWTMVLQYAPPIVTWRRRDPVEATTGMPMTVSSQGAPQVIIQLNSVASFPVEIDLNYTGIVALPASVLRTVGAYAQNGAGMTVASASGRTKQYVRLEKLSIGEHGVEQAVCEVLDGDAVGRLGTGFLQHFQTMFHFEEGKLSFKAETGRFYVDLPLFGCGLFLDQLQDTSWQVAVAMDSPAWRAGIRPGDCLYAIDGQPLEELGAETAEKRLNKKTEERLTVDMQRGQEQATFILGMDRLL